MDDSIGEAESIRLEKGGLNAPFANNFTLLAFHQRDPPQEHFFPSVRALRFAQNDLKS